MSKGLLAQLQALAFLAEVGSEGLAGIHASDAGPMRPKALGPKPQIFGRLPAHVGQSSILLSSWTASHWMRVGFLKPGHDSEHDGFLRRRIPLAVQGNLLPGQSLRLRRRRLDLKLRMPSPVNQAHAPYKDLEEEAQSTRRPKKS